MNYGTGSYPWPPQGWHLLSLLIVSHKPLRGPYFFNASIPYCEQVGVNRHLGPSHGDMIHWYIFMRKMKGRLSMYLTCCICKFYKPVYNGAHLFIEQFISRHVFARI